MNHYQVLVQCPGCGAWVYPSDGETHAYIGANAGCWAVYNEVLAAEYARGYSDTVRLIADTYAAQHPGTPSRRSVQSVAVHLISLYYLLERGHNSEKVMLSMSYALQHADRFRWLEPPTSLGSITIYDILEAQHTSKHGKVVELWALNVWDAWKQHHPTVQRWAAGG